MRLLAAAVLVVPALAFANADEDRAEILVATRVYEQLEGVPADVMREIDRRGARLGPEKLLQAHRSAQRMLHPHGLTGTARGELESRATTREQAAMLAWVRSPMGKRIQQLTVNPAASPGAEAGKPATPARIERVRRLVELTDAARFAATRPSMIQLIADTVINHAEQNPDGAISGYLREQMWEERTVLAKKTTDLLVRDLTLRLAPLTDEEIDLYLAFADSPLGKALYTARREALEEALLTPARSVGHDFYPKRKDVPPTPEELRNLDALMENSGLMKVLRQAAGDLDQELADNPEKIDAATRARIANELSPKRLQADARRYFVQFFFPDGVRALLAWHATPLGKRMLAMDGEVLAAPVDPAPGAAAFAKLRESYDTLSRERARRIERVVGYQQFSWYRATVVAGNVRLRDIAAHPGKPPSEIVDAVLRDNWTNLLDNANAFALPQAAIAYKDLSDEELDRFIAFSRTDRYEHYRDTAVRAIGEAMEAAGKRVRRTGK